MKTRLSAYLLTFSCLSFVFTSLSVSVPVARAEVIDSTNYRLEGATFTSGGGAQTSGGGYGSYNALGEFFSGQSSSGSFSLSSGSNFEILSDVPLAPTVTNVTGSNYDRLKVVLNISNSEDQTNGTVFAIQVSDDSFASRIWYVQSDFSISTVLGSEDYLTYSGWGGASGQVVTTLSGSTTYQFRVRAFNGLATENDWGPSGTAATVAPQVGLSLSGGTCSPVTATATANALSFGAVIPGTVYTCPQTITSSTNALSGFVTRLSANQITLTSGSHNVDPFSGSWTTPAVWSTPPGTTPDVNTGFFGYTSNDTTIESAGGSNKFLASTLYAGVETTPREVASSTTPAVAGQANVITSKIEVNLAQPSGSYGNMVISYEISGTF